MKTVSADQAGSGFPQLLSLVRLGEEVVITEHDQPVARLIPEAPRSLERVRAAVRGLRELQQEIANRNGGHFQLSDEEIQSAIEEGRA